MAAVLLAPTMGAIFGRPRRAAGLYGAVAGFVGLAAFYTLLFKFGARDAEHETYVWRVAGVELWQSYAVICVLPISFLGYLAGNLVGGRADAGGDLA